MGGHHHSTNTHVQEDHNKDITQTNNNVETENNHYKEHNTEMNTLNGDKAYGGGAASNGDSNYGNAVYKLVNLDGANVQLQNLGFTDLFTAPIHLTGKGVEAIWKLDKKSYKKVGKGVVGGIEGTAKAIDDTFGKAEDKNIK